MNRNDLRNSMGIITTRKCPACGHHETGYISEDGSFKPLRPGDMISIIHSEQQLPDDTIQQELSINMTAPQEENDQQCLELWVPETLKHDLRLSMKYGVLTDTGINRNIMTGEIYRNAYLNKLKLLIEKEQETPLPIILDRFFSAPELAGGNPGQIAEYLYEEIEDVKYPAIKMIEWLDKTDNENIENFIPESIEKTGNEPINNDQLIVEFNKLTLEDFFEML